MADLSSVFLKVKNILPQYFIDKVDINRRIKIKSEDGSVKYDLPEEPIIKDVPCSISYKIIDNPDTDDVAKNPLVSVVEIFLQPDVEVFKGDTITAHKYNHDKTQILSTYTGVCNEPILYPTHKQIQVILKGNA